MTPGTVLTCRNGFDNDSQKSKASFNYSRQECHCCSWQLYDCSPSTRCCSFFVPLVHPWFLFTFSASSQCKRFLIIYRSLLLGMFKSQDAVRKPFEQHLSMWAGYKGEWPSASLIPRNRIIYPGPANTLAYSAESLIRSLKRPPGKVLRRLLEIWLQGNNQ